MMFLNHYKRVPIVGLSCSIAALSVLVWNPATPPIWVAAVLSVVAFGIGTTYPVGTVSIQNAVSRYQVGAAMGGVTLIRHHDDFKLAAPFQHLIQGGPGQHI